MTVAQLTAPLVKLEIDVTERLEPRPEPRACDARLGDRSDPALVGRGEVQDPVGLAEPDGAQQRQPRTPSASASSLVQSRHLPGNDGMAPRSLEGAALAPRERRRASRGAGIRAATASLKGIDGCCQDVLHRLVG